MATPILKKTEETAAEGCRYFMTLSFNGTRFHGWQRQPGDMSVQETIEAALAKLLRRETALTGAGRTDAGVHARKMVAHFDTVAPIADEHKFIGGLNAMTGHDIAIESITRVANDAHARFDATSRTYHYYAIDHKSPFAREMAWKAPADLDYEAMNEAAKLLLKTSDFTSFAKLHSDAKTNICKVTRAEWIDKGDGVHVFVITADRFLRNMVRAVVGTLVEVGRGKLDIEGFKAVIDGKNRCMAGTSMPAHGLYLWDVTYDQQ